MSKNKSKIKYLSHKKNPTPDAILHDMRAIARKHGVYIKDADLFSDYFAEKVASIRLQAAYYYATRLESLAYRHERARRHYSKNQLKAVG